jgi:hypothetical protein
MIYEMMSNNSLSFKIIGIQNQTSNFDQSEKMAMVSCVTINITHALLPCS